MTKIHVLADETLGGIKREFILDYEEINGGRKTTTLEPTDIVHIDGKRYKLVDRKAEVGELAIYYFEGKSDGIVFDVLGSGVSSIEVDYYAEDDDQISGISHGAYRVLEPVESSPKTNDEIIANLVKRVAELERENKRTLRQYAIDKLSEEVEDLEERIQRNFNGMKDDIETWAREHEKTKQELDDKIEMCIDDIAFLDERTAEDEPRVFPKILTYSPDDLSGKVLRIMVGSDIDNGVMVKVISGIDEETGKVYVLSSEVLTYA